MRSPERTAVVVVGAGQHPQEHRRDEWRRRRGVRRLRGTPACWRAATTPARGWRGSSGSVTTSTPSCGRSLLAFATTTGVTPAWVRASSGYVMSGRPASSTPSPCAAEAGRGAAGKNGAQRRQGRRGWRRRVCAEPDLPRVSRGRLGTRGGPSSSCRCSGRRFSRGRRAAARRAGAARRCARAGAWPQDASREDVPGWDNSAMDGYAVRAVDTAGASADAPAKLRLAGESRAGAPADATLGAGEAFGISTGAVVPEGRGRSGAGRGHDRRGRRGRDQRRGRAGS